MRRFRTVALFAALVLSSLAPMAAATAAPIALTEVRTGTSFQTFTMDPTTGKYYGKSTYGSVTSLTEYANRADFLANVPSGAVALAPAAAGPYVTVSNGDLYARTSTDSSGTPVATGVWDLASGSQTATAAAIGTVGGGNVGFNWGGYSNGNFLQDETGVYFLGSSTNGTSSIWEIHKVDANLNSIASQSFSVAGLTAFGSTQPGFAFMIGGQLFVGESYNSDFVTGQLDFATGSLTITSLEVDGAWGSSYWNSTFYDSNADVLYMNNTNVGNLYAVEGAAAAFGVSPAVAVPEPGAVALLGLGLAGIGFARRRRAA